MSNQKHEPTLWDCFAFLCVNFMGLVMMIGFASQTVHGFFFAGIYPPEMVTSVNPELTILVIHLVTAVSCIGGLGYVLQLLWHDIVAYIDAMV